MRAEQTTKGERMANGDLASDAPRNAHGRPEAGQRPRRRSPAAASAGTYAAGRQEARPQPRLGTGQRHGESGAHPAPDAVPQGYLGEVPPPIAAPTWKRRLYVDRPADLRALAQDLLSAGVLAIDAEFSQVRVRTSPDGPSHRLALLQLACDNDYRVSYVVDAQRLADLSPLQDVLENPLILKLFHGIGADTKVLATRNLVVRTTLDLEAVSRSIFGQRESGLAAMLRRACDIRLDKSLQRADWSRRPLTPAMVAYAARDAEMTLVLHGWLCAHYPWAVDLHETPADEPPPLVAGWIAPFLEGARPRPALVAVAEAGLGDDEARQVSDIRDALAAVRHPNQRARVMRLITDLELTALSPHLRPYLEAPASEERSGAARALGRLRDRAAAERIRPLLTDPVQDVRQAAQLTLENLGNRPVARKAPRPQVGGGSVRWTSGDSEDAHTDQVGWRATLRKNFGNAMNTETNGER